MNTVDKHRFYFSLTLETTCYVLVHSSDYTDYEVCDLYMVNGVMNSTHINYFSRFDYRLVTVAVITKAVGLNFC